MIPLNSIRSRFAVSLVSNILRGLLTLLTTIFLARLLGADDYGRIAFIVATFQSLRQLLDPGVSSAFYTFLSQKMRSAAFLSTYGVFLLGKYLMIIFVLGMLMPDSWISYVWRGESRDILIFALSAVLIQFEWWPSVMYILESQRRTVLAQSLYLILLALQLIGVYILYLLGILTIMNFMLMSSVLWAGGTICSILYYIPNLIVKSKVENQFSLQEYLVYCVPMVYLGFLSFFVEFFDRWLIQAYAGSREQSYFSVSQQVAAIILILTSSLIKVLWKEIAESLHSNRIEHAWSLYSKTKKGLYFASVFIAAGLAPWSEEILAVIFGLDYIQAAPVFMIMIFAATFQTLGQIEGALMMASGKTRTGLYYNIISTPLSMVLSYILIVGTYELGEQVFSPLGAIGLAVKLLVVQVFSVNVLGYLLCEKLSWKFEWLYQISTIIVLVTISSLAKIILCDIFQNLLTSFVIVNILYAIAVLSFASIFPRLLETGFKINYYKIMHSNK